MAEPFEQIDFQTAQEAYPAAPMQTVSIDTTSAPVEQKVSIDTGATGRDGIPVSQETAARRAKKFAFGIPSLDKRYQEINERIRAGDEDKIRREIAAEIDFRKQEELSQNLLKVSREMQRPLKPYEVEHVTKLIKAAQYPTDPDIVMEAEYSKQWIRTLDDINQDRPDTLANELKAADPEAYERVKEQFGSRVLQQIEFLTTLEENVKEEISRQSWPGYGADWLKSAVPFYTSAKLRGGKADEVNLTRGGALEARAKYYLRLPLPQMKTELLNDVNQLKQDNPQAALELVEAVKGLSTAGSYLHSVGEGLLDPLSIPGGGWAVKKGLNISGLIKHTARASTDLVNAATVAPASKAAAAEGAGNLAESAVQKVLENSTSRATGQRQLSEEIIEDLPRTLRQDLADAVVQPGRFNRELTVRLTQSMDNLIARLMPALMDFQRVNRVVGLENPEMVKAIQTGIRDEFPGIQQDILNISEPYKLKATNTLHVDVDIGNMGATLFSQPKYADNYAKHYGLTKYQVVPQGDGFFIRIQKNVRETDDYTRDYIAKTASTKDPEKFMNSIFGFLRNPDENLSVAQRENRKIAVYTPPGFLEMAREEFKYISKLSKGLTAGKRERYDSLQRVIKLGRDLPDPDNNNLPGYFFKSAGEVEDAYMRHIGRLPDLQELEAYFAYKRLAEMDRIFRNINVFRNKARLGVEQFQITLRTDGPENILSGWVDAVRMNNFPGGATGDRVAILGTKAGDTKIYSIGEIPEVLLNGTKGGKASAPKTGLKEAIKNGEGVMLELYAPHEKPLQRLGQLFEGDQPRYVYVPHAEMRPIPWEQVPRRGGGHFEPEYDFYIKQPNITMVGKGKYLRYLYNGDNTVMPIAIRAMGAQAAESLDAVRELLRKASLHKSGTKEYKDFIGQAKTLTENTLPIEFKELRSWFQPSKDPTTGNIIPPRLNLSERIQVIRANASTATESNELKQKYGALFRDGTKEGNMSRMHQVQFTGERDLFELKTLNNVGSQANPIWKYEPAKFIDPIPSMNRALSRIINSTYLDDYKLFSMETWLRNAERYLKVDHVDQLKYAPYAYFNKPDFLADTPTDILNKLTTQWTQIQRLLGTPSKYETAVKSIEQKVADWAYNHGNGARTKALLDTGIISKTLNPFDFLRTVTFHAKLGMGNIGQFMIQNQTYATILGTAGWKYAAPGTHGAYLEFLARVNKNPQILAALDKKASSLNLPGSARWKPGEWLEAYNELRKTGFGLVGGEYALLDTALTPTLVRSRGKVFLDAASFFFREGERNVRHGAWYTAFKEFRDKNPFVKIDDVQRAKILERADILNVNMSRASSSILHTGPASITSQFLSYQLRAAELFWSKRLGETAQERAMARARMMTTYAALYGAPTVAGITGFPISDYFRTKALENNYVVGDNWMTSMFMEGFPAFVAAFVTGGGDIKKGNWYNIGDQYGIQGFEVIREAMRSDKGIFEILGGAAYSTFSGALEATDGFVAAMMSGIRDDDKYFHIRPEHAIDVAKQISSVNRAWQTWQAIDTQKWMSKKGYFLSDQVSPWSAAFMAVTGLRPQSDTDTNLMALDITARRDKDKYVRNQFIREYRRALKALDDGNETLHKTFMTNAFAFLHIGGYPEEKFDEVISQATKDWEPMTNRVKWDFYIKTAPRDGQDAATDAWIRSRKIQDQRGER